MNKEFKALKIIEDALNDNHFYKHIITRICEYLNLDIKSHRDLIETESEILNCIYIEQNKLEVLELLKEICLDGKDKYGKGTWGWVEFDLDKYPKLKEWLK